MLKKVNFQKDDRNPAQKNLVPCQEYVSYQIEADTIGNEFIVSDKIERTLYLSNTIN